MNKKAGVVKTSDVFNILRIFLLVLPIIYFAKKGFQGYEKTCKTGGLDGKCWINVLQKIFLITYFSIVAIELVLLTVNASEDIMKFILYIKLSVVTFLVFFSYALCYISYDALPTSVFLLFMTLATLYLISFIASINSIQGINNEGVKLFSQWACMILAFLLAVLFMMQISQVKSNLCPSVPKQITLPIIETTGTELQTI